MKVVIVSGKGLLADNLKDLVSLIDEEGITGKHTLMFQSQCDMEKIIDGFRIEVTLGGPLGDDIEHLVNTVETLIDHKQIILLNNIVSGGTREAIVAAGAVYECRQKGLTKTERFQGEMRYNLRRNQRLSLIGREEDGINLQPYGVKCVSIIRVIQAGGGPAAWYEFEIEESFVTNGWYVYQETMGAVDRVEMTGEELELAESEFANLLMTDDDGNLLIKSNVIM